jgi:hypothetical protein
MIYGKLSINRCAYGMPEQIPALPVMLLDRFSRSPHISPFPCQKTISSKLSLFSGGGIFERLSISES